MKTNCWEYKQCGRQEGGTHAEDLGVCPAAAENRLNGIHGGMNAGRACWVVAGTLCQGSVQGSFANKYAGCNSCDFYREVKKNEYPAFKLAAVLLERLRA